jgi:mono/diheme cytochrome c family protein
MSFSRAQGPVIGGLVAILWLAAGATTALARDADPKKGEEVYAAQQCAVCHSVAGKGNKKYPLDGAGARLSAAEIREWLVNPDAQQAKKNERSLMKMKSYRSLPAEDLDALVAYIESLK